MLALNGGNVNDSVISKWSIGSEFHNLMLWGT